MSKSDENANPLNRDQLAWELGYLSFTKGWANPYSKDTQEYVDWCKGFENASLEFQGL